jgi:hypothetical protein
MDGPITSFSETIIHLTATVWFAEPFHHGDAMKTSVLLFGCFEGRERPFFVMSLF